MSSPKVVKDLFEQKKTKMNANCDCFKGSFAKSIKQPYEHIFALDTPARKKILPIPRFKPSRKVR